MEILTPSFASPVISDQKPYNRCLTCHHREERSCDGPRTSAMTFARWCEFMRLMRGVNHLTNAEIAKRSDVSEKTIERIMKGKYDQDIYRDTARRIEEAILGTGNQYPCYLAYEEAHPQDSERLNDALRDLERALSDNSDYRKALDNIHDSYKAEIQEVRNESRQQHEEDQRKIDYLRTQVERLQRENDNLWEENKRKSRIVDRYIDSNAGRSV